MTLQMQRDFMCWDPFFYGVTYSELGYKLSLQVRHCFRHKHETTKITIWKTRTQPIFRCVCIWTTCTTPFRDPFPQCLCLSLLLRTYENENRENSEHMSKPAHLTTLDRACAAASHFGLLWKFIKDITNKQSNRIFYNSLMKKSSRSQPELFFHEILHLRESTLIDLLVFFS